MGGGKQVTEGLRIDLNYLSYSIRAREKRAI